MAIALKRWINGFKEHVPPKTAQTKYKTPQTNFLCRSEWFIGYPIAILLKCCFVVRLKKKIGDLRFKAFMMKGFHDQAKGPKESWISQFPGHKSSKIPLEGFGHMEGPPNKLTFQDLTPLIFLGGVVSQLGVAKDVDVLVALIFW